MLCLWYSELETPYWQFSHKPLSGETGNWNIPSGVGHGFTEEPSKRWEGAMKPKTLCSLTQGNEIQTFNMRRRVRKKFIAGPCLRNFMEQRQLRNEPLHGLSTGILQISFHSDGLCRISFHLQQNPRVLFVKEAGGNPFWIGYSVEPKRPAITFWNTPIWGRSELSWEMNRKLAVSDLWDELNALHLASV